MDIVSFIPEHLMVLVAVLNVLGFGFKNYPNLNNRYIPVALLLLGIIFSIWIQGLNPDAIMQGILCWGVAIGLNQIYKQLKD